MVLGNGFSIDLISKIKRERSDCSVNLSNLFNNGDKVPWPKTGLPGFLSYENCPELWKMGARPNMCDEEAKKLIDDIITCANVRASSQQKELDYESNNAYIRAYHELVFYLKYLFIYYDRQVEKEDLESVINNKWGWSELIKNIATNEQVNSLTIVTYNYDIFVERILKILNLPFQMVGFENEEKKIRLIKPHGSISFRSERPIPNEIFSIKYNRDSLGGTIEEIVVDMDVSFDKISKINTMIPPSGESVRYNLIWSKILRDKACEAVKNMIDGDELIFGGLSYCSVDRQEIDKILTTVDPSVYIKNINPSTNNTFAAVISSIFEKYIHYTDSDVLGGLFK